MKKLKIISLFLAFSLVLLTGCGGINGNIKLEQTNLSYSSFFYKSLNSTSIVTEVLDWASTEQDLNITASLANIMVGANYGSMNYLALVSAMDFCMVFDPDVAILEKIYQYPVGQDAYTIVQVVKEKNKSIYTARLYSPIISGVDYNSLFESEEISPPQAKCKISVSQDKTSGGYEFSDKTLSKTSGKFSFNKSAGSLKLSINGEDTDVNGNVTYVVDMSLYNYKNGILGGRVLVTATQNNVKTKYIQEYYNNGYYQRYKIGVVKDVDLYVNLEETEADKIAVSNSGDLYGFEAVYDATDDNVQANTVVSKYGLFPEN